MKNFLLIPAAFFISAICFGQEIKKDQHSDQKEAAYCCVKNDYCGEKAKKCPKCEQPLIKEGLFYCTKCSHSSKKPGTCGKCDIALVKMEKKS